MVRSLTAPEAETFALLLLAGAPARVAATYFAGPGADDEDLQDAANQWSDQSEVKQELLKLTGGVPWHRLSDEERLQLAMKKHYAEMAFFLWTHNYGELSGGDRQKADTCRESLERKLAGTAGKGNALDQFYEEVIGRYKMTAAQKVGRA